MGNILRSRACIAGYELTALSSLNQRSTEWGVYRDTRAVITQLKPDMPLYIFDQQQLAETADAFVRAFPGRVSYAVKANTRNRVLRGLIAQGIRHFDVASIDEIKTLAGLSDALSLHYNNPVKSMESIARAYLDFGVRSFALDDRQELEKILDSCSHPGGLLLSVRFKLDSHHAAYDFGAKFGASPAQAIDLLRRVQACGARPALTFHPGSQCVEPQEYARYIHAAAEIASAAGCELAQLNLGGGFPEYYANTHARPRSDYFASISRAHRAAFKDKRPSLMCEPGRAMVARSASLLCRVIHVRSETATLFINDGVYGGLQEQCIADLSLPLRLWRGGERLNITKERLDFNVFGPTCDPVDRLPRPLSLPRTIQAGDYLEFGLMGAYGSATSTRFNGFDSGRYVNVAKGWRAENRAQKPGSDHG